MQPISTLAMANKNVRITCKCSGRNVRSQLGHGITTTK